MGYLTDITKQLEKGQDVIFVGTGIILLDEQNRILMACRNDNQQWSLPGGSLEVGETLEECIIRETLEETGIEINEQDLVLNSVKSILEPVIKNGRQIYVVSVTYRVNKYNKENMIIDSREFNRYGWLTIDEVLKIQDKVTPYTLVAIQEYNKTLKTGGESIEQEAIK